MQRADTLYIVNVLLQLCAWFIAKRATGKLKYVLLYLMHVLTMAHEYDYNLRHLARHYFIREDLLFPSESPYIKVLNTGNDMAYIQLCRMPKMSFDYLLSNMDPDWVAWHDGFTDRTRAHRRPGREHMLKARDILALTLIWMGSSTSMHHLELLFGVGHAVLYRDLEIGLQRLVEALRLLPEAACIWPTPAEMIEFADAIEEVRGRCPYPSVRLWGWMDGLRLLIKNPDLVDVQRQYYNAWVGAAGIVCVLLQAPDGKIRHACVNYPGTQHDFTVARDIFGNLADLNKTPLWHVVAADSAFASHATNDFVATKDSFVPPLADTLGKTPAELAELHKKFGDWVGAVRQSTEHGMRTLQAVWGRLKTELPTDNAERRRIIEIAILLHNFNAHYMTSHNQTQTMYLEALLR